MSGNFFRGTSLQQDARFGNRQKKLYAQMNFPKNFSEKVDMKKVHKEIIYKWITEKVTDILGFEDEIVVSLAINQLDADTDVIDPREIQVALTGFLEKKAAPFMEELWDLLLSAQANPTGIPTKFLEQKKEELRKKKEAEDAVSKKIKEKIDESRRTSRREEHESRGEKGKPNSPKRRSPVKYQRGRSRRRRSSSPRRHRSYSRRSVDRHQRSRSTSRGRSRSHSNEKRKKSVSRRRSRSRESSEPRRPDNSSDPAVAEKGDLEKMLRQKALESLRARQS